MKENQIAKILRSNKREFDCLILETKEVVKAVCLREIIKKNHLVVGDLVEIAKQSADERFEISKLVERKNEIFRRIVRSNKRKVIASNVDLILIVTSVSKPDYKTFLIDRYLARAVQWDIPAIVIFNKMDQFDDQFDIEMEQRKYTQIGIQSFYITCEETDNEVFQHDFEDLNKLLKNKTTICLGQSGVGKSRLISNLSGGKVELLSKTLAKKINKGAHTTTWAEIVDCEDFHMVDSPGVRSMAVVDINIDELPHLFPDLVPWFNQCQFTDCRHEENSKGCCFNKLDLEEDENVIIYNRLISYLKMRDEVESVPQWQK